MAGMLSGCGSERHSQVSRAAFRSTVDGKATDLYTLRNARGLEMTVTNFGGRVVELWVPDRDGNFADIVLGHDNLGAYVDQTGERFLGATIGRYGNRIAAGRFTLDGKEYTLPLNDGPNSLHGGAKGFDMVVWDVVEVTPQKIVLACLSPDGDQGYPGNLKVTMTYELTDDNSFVITHEAATDRRTVVNLTHHSFFNLHGMGKDLLGFLFIFPCLLLVHTHQKLIQSGMSIGFHTTFVLLYQFHGTVAVMKTSLKDGQFFRILRVLLQIIDTKVTTENYISVIISFFACDDIQQGCFSGTVLGDQSHTLAFGNAKRYIFKKNQVTEGLGQVVYL